MAKQLFLDEDKQLRTLLPPWGQEVEERAQELGDLLEHVDPDHCERFIDLLETARRIAFDKVPLWKVPSRLTDWWYGSRVERAWSLIHQAELFFVEYADDRGLEIALDNALSYAEALPRDDPVRVRFAAHIAALAEAQATGVEPVVTVAPGPPAVVTLRDPKPAPTAATPTAASPS
jgi:hypothetical protein